MRAWFFPRPHVMRTWFCPRPHFMRSWFFRRPRFTRSLVRARWAYVVGKYDGRPLVVECGSAYRPDRDCGCACGFVDPFRRERESVGQRDLADGRGWFLLARGLGEPNSVGGGTSATSRKRYRPVLRFKGFRGLGFILEDAFGRKVLGSTLCVFPGFATGRSRVSKGLGFRVAGMSRTQRLWSRWRLNPPVRVSLH